jgi:glycine/D-amino acid oxidase-like deaminating enzyme
MPSSPQPAVLVIGAGITGLASALMLVRGGAHVRLIDAISAGAGATGSAAGVVSLEQADRVPRIARSHPRSLVDAYLAANRDGDQWLRGFCADRGIPTRGIDESSWYVDPQALVSGLLDALGEEAVTVESGVVATGLTASAPCRVSTSAGEISADSVVLATGAPFLARGLYAVKSAPRRVRSIEYAGGSGVGSGVDWTSHNEIPFVGLLPRGRGRVWFATGYDGWGYTNGVAAAMRISSEILGEEPPEWVGVIGRRLTVPADIAEGVGAATRTAADAVRRWASAPRSPVRRPAEGEGLVVRRGVRPFAISTVDGVTRAVPALAPRGRGLLHWDSAEATWNSPDGSRYAPDGAWLGGPCVRDLPVIANSARG